MGLEKRGLGKVGTTLIIIIVIVAAILIYSFSKREKPSPLSEQCAYFCETNQSSAFCNFKVSVNDNLRLTCNELLTNSAYLAYGVQACPEIFCTTQIQGNSAQASDQTCSGLDGTWKTPTASGTCPAQEGKFARKRTPTDNPQIVGQICCYYYQ